MDRNIPSPPRMRKYREMGFDRHHILEAWDQCKGREYSLLDTLFRIRSRDQLLSEQRLVWDGKKHPPIKRIVNQTPLKSPSASDDRQEYHWEEFRKMKKKGLLLKKEYRGMRALSFEFQEGRPLDEDMERLAELMKGYHRRLRHLSIGFHFWAGWMVNIVPLLKSIRHNFVGLVSLKLSLKRDFILSGECLYGFDRLFAQLGPTLKHLDLDFAENSKSEVNFPDILGWVIMENLHKIETISLNFRNTQFPITLVRFFINIACPKMKKLRSLRLQMENCLISNEGFFSQASSPSNLKCLQLDFNRCANLDTEYVSNLQKDILVACPALEELFIRLPNYNRFSGKYLSVMKEEFLQKVNLKKFGVELSHELEETWDHYHDVQVLERAEELRIDSFARRLKQNGYGEEELRLCCETLTEEENLPEGLSDMDENEYEEYMFKAMDKDEGEMGMAWEDEAERRIREGRDEEESEAEYEILKMADWYDEEGMYHEVKKIDS